MKSFTTLCLMAVFALAASQYAVSSVHNDCGSSCTNNANCCGSDSYCAGSVETRCCPNNAGFCGCISARGYCSGYVFHQSAPTNGSNSFGACYDSSQAGCTYNPLANQWIVCPNTYNSCPSSNGYSCCSSGETCYTNSGATFATCAFPTGGPNVIVPTAGQTLQYNTAYTFKYVPVVAGDAAYNVIYGGNNQAFGNGVVNSDGSISFTYTLRSFSPSSGNIALTFVEGNVSTTVNVYATTASTSSSTPTSTTQATPTTQGTPAATPIDTADCLPNGCAGGALCCGGQCYSTGQYQCYQKPNGSYQLCPQGTNLCGSACYNPANYSCTNGQLALA